MNPILYLGLEIKQRELDSRLLIAVHALDLGLPVVFGQQWGLFGNIEALPPGAVLFKTVNDIQAKCMKVFSKAGHLVTATDEEVLVCFEDACFFEVFSPTAAERCDLFFAQSDIHKAAIDRKFPDLATRTKVVGNARIDLLSPRLRESFEEEAAAIKAEHGPFILFNTNYGQINSIWADMNKVYGIAAGAGLVDIHNPESVTEYKNKLKWEAANREEIIGVLRWALHNLKDHKIVLRPHPGELAAFWQELGDGHDRFTVIPRSNPHPWLVAADMLVHTTCTTGLEAALLDKPAVNVVPVPHPTFDYITNYINPTFKTWQEAAAAMDAFFTNGSGPIVDSRDKFAAALENYFPHHRDGDSTRKIVEEIVAALAAKGARPRPDYRLEFREPGYRRGARSDILKDKFTLEADELIAGLKAAMNLLGIGLKLKVAAIDDSLFYITRTA